MKTLFPTIALVLCLATASHAQSPRPIFPVTYTTPSGWKVAKTENNNTVLLPSGTSSVDALIVTHTGLYARFEPLVAGLAASLKDLRCTNVQVSEEGERTVKGKKAYVARGTAQNAQGAPVVFALYATLSGKQLGAGLFVLATDAQAEGTIRAAESLLGSVGFGTFTPSKLGAAALVGNWEGGTAEGSRTSGVGGLSIASSTRYTFQSAGTFSTRSQSIASASGEFGDLGSSLSKSSDTQDEGQYFVVGKKLILSSAKNGTTVVDYTLQNGILKLGGVLLRKR